MFDRFEIVEAYYHYLQLTHEGQFSRKYSRLSKLLGYYKPSRLGTLETASENVREAVETLLAR